MTLNPRIKFNPNELVISKKGKNANNPALPDADKIYDSKWGFGGSVIKMGVAEFEWAPGSAPYAIPFGMTLPFIPSVILNWCLPAGRWTTGYQDRSLGLEMYAPLRATWRPLNGEADQTKWGDDPITITSSEIRIPRPRPTVNNTQYPYGWTHATRGYFQDAGYRRMVGIQYVILAT